MKLTKITLNNFRAFPGGRSYELPLNKSGNLLLYGENGSGKSSIAVALREFFNPLSIRPAITHWANNFSGKDKKTTTVELGFDPTPDVIWSDTSDSMRDTRVKQNAHRCLVLDYRDMLAVTAFSKNPGRDLFYVAIEKILAKVEAKLGGYTEETIGEFWVTLQAALQDEKTKTKTRQTATDGLKQALAAKLPDWQKEIDETLKAFRFVPLGVKLVAPQLHYDGKKKKLTGDEFGLELNFNGDVVTNPREFLNEATLSAFAISLFMSAARLTAPDAVPGIRLLILDDILIGLDLSNRLAVLELLKTQFPLWQVILITHNRHWFEAARQYLPEWTQAELYRAVIKDISSTLTLDDFIDPASIAGCLALPARAFDAWIENQISSEAQSALASYQSQTTDSKTLKQVILQDLNKLICGPLIFESSRFDGIAISADIKVLLSQSPVGNSLASLNRLLLQEAYPQAFSKANTTKKREYWRPVLQVDHPYLERAKQHLDEGDLKASAVYLRTGFERMLRLFVEDNDLPIKFRADHREVECSEFWNAVKGFKKLGGGKLVGGNMAKAIEVCRSHVLNDVVHFGSTQPCREELLQTYSLLVGLDNILFPPPVS